MAVPARLPHAWRRRACAQGVCSWRGRRRVAASRRANCLRAAPPLAHPEISRDRDPPRRTRSGGRRRRRSAARMRGEATAESNLRPPLSST
eukprot:6717905-Prymnesium_polylepis.1